jgi:hypothetical protein
VKVASVTVVETHAFAKAADALWTEAERGELVAFLGSSPEAGDVIPGTGGVRKLRWRRSGAGKRGGARVIYFFHRWDRPLYLLLAYAKAQIEDLTADEKKAVTAFALAIKAARD